MSADWSPKKPTGSGVLWTWRRWIWDRLAGGGFPIRGDDPIKVEWVNGFYRVSSKPTRAGGGGSRWHRPSNNLYEVDPTYTYDEGSVIHIQPTSSLVVTGMRDAAHPIGPVVTSCAGYWVATQNVPSKTSVAGNDVWNLPQYPMPVPTNVDDPTNFWIYFGEAMP